MSDAVQSKDLVGGGGGGFGLFCVCMHLLFGWVFLCLGEFFSYQQSAV